MQPTPHAFRKHIVLLGDTNAGKSTLFNALTGQNTAIVSPTPGTTTDPVRAAMELLPFGPVVLVDTAGSGDDSVLGIQRMEKTTAACRRADVALYVADATSFRADAYARFQGESLPHLLVFTKTDQLTKAAYAALETAHPTAVFFAPKEQTQDALHQKLSALLSAQHPDDKSLIGGLVAPGSVVVMVVPVDSQAPKGRLILPQVQLIRDCLDSALTCHVTRESELTHTLAQLRKIDLVVTDSQAFAYVNARTPRDIPLTSFSMLLARQKGNFSQLAAGCSAIETLPPNARILMLEGCTHNHTHEDIGRVKIPALLHKKTGHTFSFDFFSGYDFPSDLSAYSLAIQCGSCMINRQEVLSRLAALQSAGLPVTNYGIFLAWANGILARCCEIFPEDPV